MANITNQAIRLINKIELNTEFLKSDIVEKIGCRDKSLTYCFSELVKRGYLTIKQVSKKYTYRRVEKIAEFITCRNKNKPAKAIINVTKDNHYLFNFGGNEELMNVQ